MSTLTDPDIAHLDFDVVLPCELETHARHHLPDEPASWIVTAVCPCGARSRGLCCMVGQTRLLAGAAQIICRRCGATSLDRLALTWAPLGGGR